MKKNNKVKLLAAVLFVVTACAIAFFPGYQSYLNAKPLQLNAIQNNHAINGRKQIEAVFVLDTTSSMSGLIDAAKEKIWSIASTMASAEPTPLIKIGLVGFRDRGDQYVTKVIDMSEDLDTVYASLMDFRAEGGGDGPESVNQALYEAVNNISWSQDDSAYKVIFLVGDAPPHMDYQDDIKYPHTLKLAHQKGIVVNSIQCGDYHDATLAWRRIAQLGQGDFFRVAQDGNAVTIATPYDREIAEVSKRLDQTKLYYGDDETKRKQEAKLSAAEKLSSSASLPSLARRGVFNASKGGESNYLGEGELVHDVSEGRVDLSRINKNQLPKNLQALPQEALEEVVVEKAKTRKVLQQKIKVLADKRQQYVKSKLKEKGGADESLDNKLFGAIKSQALEKGLEYDEDAVEY